MRSWRKNQFLTKVMHLHYGVCVVSFVAIAGVSLIAQEWPQFLGPGRDGVYE